MIKFVYKNFYLLLIIYGVFTLIPFLGDVHLFDWDEANFAELAREMILTKNYLQPQINYLPFYEKPPIFIWLQVISMKIFGINEFAARFPNALLGILVMVSLYWIGKREHDERFGRIWVLSYMGSFLPFMYFRTGLIDPWFNYFMFLSLYFYYIAAGLNSNQILGSKIKDLLASAFFLGLAVQTKGPAAFIIVFGTIGILWAFSRFKSLPGILNASVWILSSLFFSCLWFLYETYHHGTSYMYEFIVYQIRLFTTEDALHGGPIYYHIIVLLLGCFPSSFVLLFTNDWKEKLKNDWYKIMCICGILVLVLFSIVQTKIIHYSSMAYFPISYIAAHTLYNNSIRNLKLAEILIKVFSLVVILALIAMPIIGNNLTYILPYVDDIQAKLQLGADVNWCYWEVCFGIFILMVLVIAIKKSRNKLYPYFFSTIAIVLVLLVVFAPKIECYTQRIYIDFCKSLSGQDVNIKALYFKSYATMFYSGRQPFANHISKDHNWILEGLIDKDAYVIYKTKDSILYKYPKPDVELIQSKLGFDIWLRKAKKF